MKHSERQIVAEKIGSTVRVLELLGFEYVVTAPKNKRKKGNACPRVVYVEVGESQQLRVYNSINGYTWANEPSGKPIPQVKSIEELYMYLRKKYKRKV
jgi:hypothetical protein